eukprot:jgi/Psemu1/4245/gm1.4245_g
MATRMKSNSSSSSSSSSTKKSGTGTGTETETETTTACAIQPFEWLTSPDSIGGFVREHVLLPMRGSGNDRDHGKNNTNSNNSSRGRTNPGLQQHQQLQQQQQQQQLPKAMHIGCGSSTVGEYLVHELGFGTVVNVDRDRETLEGMEERWWRMLMNRNRNRSRTRNGYGDANANACRTRIRTPEFPGTTQSELSSESESIKSAAAAATMEFWCLDYTRERLPESYASSFDLVVDKSTLDCTLCSDCASTASFLAEIYRTLNPDGGVYLIVSFHEIDLLLPLVEDLPGADWTVSHTTMERKVECVVANAKGYNSNINNSNNWNSNSNNWNSDNNNNNNNNNDTNQLNFDAVVRHVQEVNDRWFRDEQPLLTEERILDLGRAFGVEVVAAAVAAAANNNNGSSNDDDDDDEKKDGDEPQVAPVVRSETLCLEQAYEAMFTEAEREHLTFELFLEDWEAFCEDGHHRGDNPRAIDYDTALRFLEANQ